MKKVKLNLERPPIVKLAVSRAVVAWFLRHRKKRRTFHLT